MKKIIIQFLLFVICAGSADSQPLTGTKTIPGNYSSVAAAIADLNTFGVGAGGVVFNIGAGIFYSETASSGGLALGSAILNASLSSVNTLVFQKAATALANPLIIAYTGGTGTPATAVQDGIFRIVGCDDVTIDGIDLAENAANTTNPSTMEYGYALYKASLSDGCMYNTIKNCVITLNRMNNATAVAPMQTGSVGIIMHNSIPTAATTALIPTTAVGTNSYNKIYGNTIQNCNIGIGMTGYASAGVGVTNDAGNDIGGSASTTGNSILNYGGGTGAVNPAYGIQIINQWGINVSYNNVDNNNGSGVNHPLANLYGISCSGGTGSYGDVTNNTVSLKSNATTQYVYGISVNFLGAYQNINYNSITNCTCSLMTSGFFYGLTGSGALKVKFIYNTVSGISIGASSGTFPQVYGIYSYTGGTPPDSVFAMNNNINNLTITASASGFLTGISLYAGKVQRAYTNTINNLTITGTGTSGTITGMVTGNAFYTGISSVLFNGNTLSNFSVTQTGASAGGNIYAFSNSSSNGVSLTNNSVHHLIGNGAAYIYGMYMYAGGSPYNNNIGNNTMYTFSSNGGPVYGLWFGSTGVLSFYKNKLYDFSSTGANGTIRAVYLSAINPGANITNNYIGDLRTPTATNVAQAIIGLYTTNLPPVSTLNVYYNTIYLNAVSSGANFSTTSFYHGAYFTSTNAALTLQNNIIVNGSTPNGAGKTIAFERSSVDLTNYLAASNNNLFYAGTPGANHLIYYDVTNNVQTLAAFKTLVGTSRESNSVTEFPPFLNTSGTASAFLHINPQIATQVNNGGISIAGVSDDFDLDARNPVTPDIGADEMIAAPLPVKWLSFTGENKNEINYLAWTTGSEINNDYFDVERRTDSDDFKKIGAVAGHGNSSQTIRYSFDDLQPKAGVNYYRLKQVDYNGDFEYSETIALNYQVSKSMCSEIYTIRNGLFRINCSGSSNSFLEIVDVHGRKVFSEKISPGKDDRMIEFDLRSFAAGLYFVTVADDVRVFHAKVLNP
ncbi:MAG: hypothetical protein NT126_07205 [Bacteroidetes bacterium]|nr:hypothetical protein [Bacteroidota bacterium]